MTAVRTHVPFSSPLQLVRVWRQVLTGNRKSEKKKKWRSRIENSLSHSRSLPSAQGGMSALPAGALPAWRKAARLRGCHLLIGCGELEMINYYYTPV